MLLSLGVYGWLVLAQAPAHELYNQGVAHARAQERDAALNKFESARAQAGGEWRLAAIYNLGTLELQEGERWRAKLPELQQQTGAAALPLPPAAASKDEPDALTQARQHYRKARQHFVERLRIDWKDADTRANAELVHKRLAELDKIEAEREKKKQEQQQQPKKPDEQPDKQKDPKQDPKQDEQDKPPQEPQQSDAANQDQKPQQQDPADKPEEPEKAEQPKPQPPAQPEGLSKEQMVQLLDRLQKLEEQGQKVQAQLQQARRSPVKKDW